MALLPPHMLDILFQLSSVWSLPSYLGVCVQQGLAPTQAQAQWWQSHTNTELRILSSSSPYPKWLYLRHPSKTFVIYP